MFLHVLLVVWKRITIFAQDYEKDYQFMDDCSKDDGDSNAVVLTTTSIELYSVVNNTNQVTITTTDRWTATCNAQWVTFSPKSGEAGTHTITISTTETNRTKALRTAQLEISASSTRKSITIKQRDDYAIFDS